MGDPTDEETEEGTEDEADDAAEDADDEVEAEDGEAEDDGGEEDTPRVVVARLAELASWLSPQLARAHADRPVWFILECDEDLHELFERLPEGPPPPRVGEQILSGLRAFAS